MEAAMTQASQTGQRVCHVRIREVAREAAAELYESMMSQNVFYEAWKKQNTDVVGNEKELVRRFVDRNWVKCIDFARGTLAHMLTRPDVAESLKDEIMNVLTKDQVLRNKRVANTRLSKAN